MAYPIADLWPQKRVLVHTRFLRLFAWDIVVIIRVLALYVTREYEASGVSSETEVNVERPYRRHVTVTINAYFAYIYDPSFDIPGADGVDIMINDNNSTWYQGMVWFGLVWFYSNFGQKWGAWMALCFGGRAFSPSYW